MPAQNDLQPDSPYGIICPVHGKQGLTAKGYAMQMQRPDSFWRCPIGDYMCDQAVDWDDERYDAYLESLNPEED